MVSAALAFQPNKAHALDGGIPVLFHIARRRPRRQ